MICKAVNKKTVSVVIPTYNRGFQLKRVIQKIIESEIDNILEIQIIVIDDSSIIPAEEFLHGIKLVEPFKIQVVRQDNAGPGAARNNGLKLAKGEIVIFIDDDVLVSPILIQKHLKAHELFPNSVIIGSYPLLLDQKRTPLLRWLNSLIDDPDMDTSKDHYILTTEVASGNLSIERSDFESGELYYNHVRTPAAEEYELMARLERTGKKIYYNPSITGWHLQPVSLKNKCMQEYKYGIGIAEVVMKVPESINYSQLNHLFNMNYSGKRVNSGNYSFKRGVKQFFAKKIMRITLRRVTRICEIILPFDWLLFPLYRFNMGVFMCAGILDGVKLYQQK